LETEMAREIPVGSKFCCNGVRGIGALASTAIIHATYKICPKRATRSSAAVRRGRTITSTTVIPATSKIYHQEGA
jgi:hypothetical protein